MGHLFLFLYYQKVLKTGIEKSKFGEVVFSYRGTNKEHNKLELWLLIGGDAHQYKKLKPVFILGINFKQIYFGILLYQKTYQK